jgi:hypothetical protein
MGEPSSRVMDTDKKTSSNMMKFVSGILVLALILAGTYFFALTPEDPASSTIGDAEQGTQDQHSR